MTGRRLAPFLIGALTVQRLSEVRMAKANEQTARERGATEFGAGHYPLFFVLHPLWLLGTVVESRKNDRAVAWPWLGVVAAANLVRLSTMRTLGPQWTTRVLITPGTQREEGGLYRFTNHPAYAAVTAEVLAVPAAVRAPRTALLGTLANLALLLLLRIPAEQRAEATRTTRSSADVPLTPGRGGLSPMNGAPGDQA